MAPTELIEWMSMPREQIAEIVETHHLSLKIAFDGSTRHYLLSKPNDEGRVLDFPDYVMHGFRVVLDIFDMVFGLGVQAVLMLAVWPPDVERRDDYVRRAVGLSLRMLGSPEAMDAYRRWDAKAGLYGNYDVSPVLAEVKADLSNFRDILKEQTSGKNLILWGFSGGGGLDELMNRTVALAHDLGRLPLEEELRKACFPDGPDNLDIYVGGGWLRVFNEDIPPMLNRGRTDLYSISHLPYDLTEREMRLILYDRIFRRYVVSPTDIVEYDKARLQELRGFYASHEGRILGLGQVVSGGFWYPEDLTHE